jgi:hypothetical protein
MQILSKNISSKYGVQMAIFFYHRYRTSTPRFHVLMKGTIRESKNFLDLSANLLNC